MQVLNSNSSRRFKRELHDLIFVEKIDRVLLSIMACRASTIVLLHCDMQILDKPLYKKEFLSVVRLAFVAVFVDSSSVDAIFPLCLRAKPSGKNYPEACRSARANMADDVVEVPVDEIEAESSLKEQNSDPKGEKRKKETLDALLEEHGLLTFVAEMKKAGVTEMQHLQDVGEQDAISEFGMSKFQAKRLVRAFQEWKVQQETAKRSRLTSSGINGATNSNFVTNNKAIVVTLPPAFQGFFGTRDGGRSVIVPSKMLEKKWRALWYENPLNPWQKASNSFVLRMCESKQHKFRGQRDCETWARKERERRIELLLAVEKNTAGWSAYYKKKSMYGSLSILEEKYPAVAAVDAKSVCKSDYEVCAIFKDKIDILSNGLENLKTKLTKAIEETLNPESGTVKTGLFY